MLIDALRGVRRKVKAYSVAYGVGIALACVVGLFLGLIFVDYLLNLPAAPRIVLSLLVLGALAYVVARWVIKPAGATVTLSDIAGRLEQAFPQFDDRLRSTVDFAHGGKFYGSDVMQQRVMSEAAALAGQLNLSSAVVAKPVWYAAASGVGAIGLVIALAVMVNPAYTRIALTRLLSPFGAPSWPKGVMIELVGRVPKRVPVGDRVEMKMKLTKGDSASRKARIYYQVNGGPVVQEFMTRGVDGVYTASLDAKAEAGKSAGAMKVWMTAGDDRKDIEQIQVLPRLGIGKVEAVITPPKYVGTAQPVTVNLADGAAMVATGSEVALRVTFNKSLAGNEAPVAVKPVTDAKKMPAFNWQRAGEQQVLAKWTASESLRFHIQATDVDGFKNTALEEYELIVRPDQTPTVQIEIPRRNEERTPVAVAPLQAVAEDDYGVNSLKLVVDRLNDRKHWEVELVRNAAPVAGVAWSKIDGSSERLRFRANYSWDLGKLDASGLKAGEILEYSLLVADNYNLNGAVHPAVASGKLRITIVSQEQFADIVTNELRVAAGQVADILNRQGRTKQETGELSKDTSGKAEFDQADRAVAERLTSQQGTAAAQSKQVAGKLGALQQRMEENKSPARDLSQLASDVKDLLNGAAENPMKAAANQITSAAQQKTDPKAPEAERKQQVDGRNEKMSGAVENQQRAAEQLQMALDKLGSVGSLSQTIERIKNLLAEQQKVTKETAAVGNANLGKRPEEMSPEDQAKLQKAATDQENLAKKTEKALNEMQKLAEQMAKSDPASAQAMKQAAVTGQQQQISPNQSKASQSAKQNQQQSAQAAQKQAEIGLTMMLNDLREAERRKLEELSKKLAELQQQVANLIRRQAGHNLDNLGVQGAAVVAKMDAKLIEELVAKAERDKAHLPPAPDLGQLTTGQEQTERNTRDIARTAEEMPNGAEPASNLTRAATKMERAIVSLRGKDLPGAYQPPQVEALAALEEAKRIVDEQKNAVDQKKDQQQREAIRVAYMKIKEDQEKLNGETLRLEKTPKLADGKLKREDSVRLGHLPGEQGKLTDRTKGLEEDLAALGSVVYIWANKDIVTSMDLVKDDLGKPDTGVVTQAEQVRVVEQLDAMIKSLKVVPLDKKFAERSGGGGGQCSPKLPAEAELRLLKELQQAVNKSTKVLSAQAKKEEPKVVALGGRQGELRELLDQILQKSSGGQMKLGKEPDNKDQLPEEAKKEDVENQELDQDLLGQKTDAERIEKNTNLIGDRMARSRQRLGLNKDAGKITQVIQDRIVVDLEKLIEESRKQECNGTGQSKPGMAQKQAPPRATGVIVQNGKPKEGQSKPNRGSSPAANSSAPQPTATQTDLSQQIKETSAEWGKISPRLRDAVIEGSSEQIIEKYRKFVEDYYKGLSQQGTEQRQ